MIRICENPKHEGNPKENHGVGIWWWKNPEWLFWCPNCSKRYFRDLLDKEMQNAKSTNSALNSQEKLGTGTEVATLPGGNRTATPDTHSQIKKEIDKDYNTFLGKHRKKWDDAKDKLNEKEKHGTAN